MDDEWKLMQDMAIQVLSHAYVPYSHRAVAAVLHTPMGRMFSGVNIENSSYGLTICAERVALFHAVTHGERLFNRILVYVKAKGVFAPCGACRHVLSEFSLNMEVGLSDDTSVIRTHALSNLIPLRTSVLEANSYE